VTSDWQQLGMAGVSARIRDVEVNVASMAEDVPMLVEAVSRLDVDVERLIAERRDTSGTIGRHDDALRDLTAAVKRLATQVAWIEQHLRASGSAQTLDLDRPDRDLQALAATADAGREAATALLDAAQRGTLEAAVAAHLAALRRYREAQRSVIDACERLPSARVDETGRRQARSDLTIARARLADARDTVANRADPARSARERLAADARDRERAATTLEAGDRARRELLTRLRTRLVAAVADGVMLPTWLTRPLGPMPPAGAAQRWTDVAAGLLAYRITYRVDDPDDAIGDLPADAPARRRRWYADLGRGVRELRR
jgi:hypothetical protein